MSIIDQVAESADYPVNLNPSWNDTSILAGRMVRALDSACRSSRLAQRIVDGVLEKLPKEHLEASGATEGTRATRFVLALLTPIFKHDGPVYTAGGPHFAFQLFFGSTVSGTAGMPFIWFGSDVYAYPTNILGLKLCHEALHCHTGLENTYVEEVACYATESLIEEDWRRVPRRTNEQIASIIRSALTWNIYDNMPTGSVRQLERHFWLHGARQHYTDRQWDRLMDFVRYFVREARGEAA